MSWGLGAQVGPGKVTHISSLCGNISKLEFGYSSPPSTFYPLLSPSVNFETFSSSLAGGLAIWSCALNVFDHPLVTLCYPG